MKRILNIAAAEALFVMVMFATASFAAQEKVAPKPKQETMAAADESAMPTSLSGKVAETMNAGGYTYILLDKNGKKTWVAVPQMTVTAGQEIILQPGQEMRNFTSKSLNKTFESIIFSGGPLAPKGSQAKNAGHGAAGNASSGGKAAAVVQKNMKVEKASGPNAYTVGDIFAKGTELDKKTAVVRGKVVKVSQGIMGSNWIHLQDGTGDAGKNTHDLVVTTQELPAVGDVVTVNGTVSANKDFGAGYKYDVLIEKASIQR